MSTAPATARGWIDEASARDWSDAAWWHWHTIDEIDARALLALMSLRSRVFVVEQACVYLDPDELDPGACFLHASVQGRCVATARVLAGGTRFAEPSIGRVCVAPELRRTGLGRALMREALEGCRRHHPGSAVRISAQAHLAGFYRGFGFEVASAEYLEDGIAHVEMLAPAGDARRGTDARS
ncbi:MAG: GNAT family N-acetyltransferase [Lautropia sp.]